MYQTSSCMLLTGLFVAVTAVAQATDPNDTLAQSEVVDRVDATTPVQGWGMTIAPPPEILRLHCPQLRGKIGLWVRQVDSAGPAAKLGIHAGDILLSASGRMLVAATALPSPELVSELVVMRRGQIRFLTPLHRNLQPFPMNNDWPSDQSVTASAFSGSFAGTPTNEGSGAVAISQVGDQISLQMTLPELGSQPVRFRGTRAQIEQQLQKSDLSTDGKRSVRRALDQSQ